MGLLVVALRWERGAKDASIYRAIETRYCRYISGDSLYVVPIARSSNFKLSLGMFLPYPSLENEATRLQLQNGVISPKILASHFE